MLAGEPRRAAVVIAAGPSFQKANSEQQEDGSSSSSEHGPQGASPSEQHGLKARQESKSWRQEAKPLHQHEVRKMQTIVLGKRI